MPSPPAHGSAPSGDLDELGRVLADLDLARARPVLILVGGASGLVPQVGERLLDLFERLAPRLDALGAGVVDGGTAFGVMSLMGRARSHAGASFPLIGVAAAGTIDATTLSGRARLARIAGAASPTAGGAQLDPHHSHILLVPGDQWGDEAPWIGAVALALAAGYPTQTLVAGGGRITRLDVSLALRAGRPLVLLGGTGGTADLLVDWWRGGAPIPDWPLEPDARGLIRVVELSEAAHALPAMLGG